MPTLGTMGSGLTPYQTTPTAQPTLGNAFQPVAAPKKKTVYTVDGAPVEVDEGTSVNVWQPNTGYSSNSYFGAPPPRPQSGGSQPSGYTGGGGGYEPASVSAMNAPIAPTFMPSAPSVQAGGSNAAGQGNITQGAYEGERSQQNEIQAQQASQAAAAAAKRGDMELAAKLQADAEARRLGMLSTVMAQGNSQPTVTRGGNLAVNEQGARDAAFARAKEQAGSTALASLTALKDVMAGSGKMGSSLESQGIADVVGGGAHDLNDYTRDQLMLDLNRAADISDQEFQGQITQRGQNLSMMPSLMGLLTASGTAY